MIRIVILLSALTAGLAGSTCAGEESPPVAEETAAKYEPTEKETQEIKKFLATPPGEKLLAEMKTMYNQSETARKNLLTLLELRRSECLTVWAFLHSGRYNLKAEQVDAKRAAELTNSAKFKLWRRANLIATSGKTAESIAELQELGLDLSPWKVKENEEALQDILDALAVSQMAKLLAQNFDVPLDLIAAKLRVALQQDRADSPAPEKSTEDGWRELQQQVKESEERRK